MVEHVIPELDKKGLREFGLVTGGIVAALFGLFFPWLFDRPLPLWPWIVFGVLGLWGLVAPVTLRPVYRLWMRFGLLMGRVMTPLIMGIVFFALIAPVGLLRRVFAKDPMAREFNDAESYRVESQRVKMENMEKPY